MACRASVNLVETTTLSPFTTIGFVGLRERANDIRNRAVRGQQRDGVLTLRAAASSAGSVGRARLEGMTVRVRDYLPQDRAAILALADRLTVGVSAWRPTDAVRRAVHGWVDSSLATNGERTAIFVSVDGEEVVGFVCVSTDQHWSGELDGYIGELVVREDREGRGIGQSLVAAAETWARAEGLGRMRLATGAANDGALAMYRSIGYSYEDVTLSRPLQK